MKTSTAAALCILITVAVTAYTLMEYSRLPNAVPTHWNLNGHVDAYGSKATILLWPGISLMSLLLLWLLPWMSPRHFKIDSFRSTFNTIMVVIAAMLGYIGVIVLYMTEHPVTDMNKALFGGILFFLGLLGNFLGKVQRNFFVGIRTPWTLASDRVWVATHRLGARLMTIGGFLGAIATWLGAPVWVGLTLVIALSLYPIIYSFLIYKKWEVSSSRT